MPLDYAIYDVFTDTALHGNPLAVVFDADALADDAKRMQAIAREFNLSETVFLSKPQNPVHAARVRIFTPAYELPFAGHPTVGSAIAMAERTGADRTGDGATLILEETIGLVRCAVRSNGVAFAEFDLPQMPEERPLTVERETVAAALGLDPQDIGFENHVPALFSAGVPYLTVPVAGLGVAARVSIGERMWRDLSPDRGDGKIASAYIYCRETVGHESTFHARMFVVGPPSYEDPATGSAAAAFAGAIMRFYAPVDGNAVAWIEQGIEMGRPSRIRLELNVAGGALKAARIGGNAVKIAEGNLILD